MLRPCRKARRLISGFQSGSAGYGIHSERAMNPMLIFRRAEGIVTFAAKE
jgi:hypothetical protein